METTFKCEQCGIDKTIDVRIPKTCSNECRIVLLAAKRRATKGQKRIKKEQSIMENQESIIPPVEPTPEVPPAEPTPLPPDDMAINVPPNVPTGAESNPNEVEQLKQDEPTGSENPNPGDLGQDTPGENPVATPPVPADNPPGSEGQA